MDEQAYALSIIEAVSRLTGIKVKEIRGGSRIGQVARARFTAQYLIRTTTSLSFPDIGRIFGARDHSTVIAACNREMQRLAQKALFQGKIPIQKWHETVMAKVAELNAIAEVAKEEEKVEPMPILNLVDTQVLNPKLFKDNGDA